LTTTGNIEISRKLQSFSEGIIIDHKHINIM